MRVRIMKTANGYWHIERKFWWWPFWDFVTLTNNEKEAISMAQRIKNPTIVEIE